MGLILGLIFESPARLVFMAFLLAASLELTSRKAAWTMLVAGSVLVSVALPTIVRPVEEPVRFIIAGFLANAIILALFYQFYVLVLRRFA